MILACLMGSVLRQHSSKASATSLLFVQRSQPGWMRAHTNSLHCSPGPGSALSHDHVAWLHDLLTST